MRLILALLHFPSFVVVPHVFSGNKTTGEKKLEWFIFVEGEEIL